MSIFFLSLSISQKGASLSLMGHSPATCTSSHFINCHCKPTFPSLQTHSVFSPSQTVFPSLKSPSEPQPGHPRSSNLSKCITTCPVAQPETSDLVLHLSFIHALSWSHSGHPRQLWSRIPPPLAHFSPLIPCLKHQTGPLLSLSITWIPLRSQRVYNAPLSHPPPAWGPLRAPTTPE